MNKKIALLRSSAWEPPKAPLCLCHISSISTTLKIPLTHPDDQPRVPLVLLPLPLGEGGRHPVRLLDEVTVAEPRHLGTGLGVDVGLLG